MDYTTGIRKQQLLCKWTLPESHTLLHRTDTCTEAELPQILKALFHLQMSGAKLGIQYCCSSGEDASFWVQMLQLFLFADS